MGWYSSARGVNPLNLYPTRVVQSDSGETGNNKRIPKNQPNNLGANVDTTYSYIRNPGEEVLSNAFVIIL